jgi:disulfide bond formation protein DsbB
VTLSVFRLQDSRFLAALVLAVSAGVLATVYASQYVFGLEPCDLCLYQRWPWWVAGGFCAIAALAPMTATMRASLCLVAGLSLLVGAGVAVYHTGVEQHWWQGPSACGGGDIPVSFSEMQRMMSKPIVPCDKPAWTFLGISMAGYNAAFSLLFGGFVTASGLRELRGKDER